jgi:hypothetical protein
MAENEELLERVHALEVGQAAQTATQAGLAAALPAGIGGLATVVVAGGVNFVIGIFLGLALAKGGRNS